MIWVGLYLLCGMITTIVSIKAGFISKGDSDPPALAVFLVWWMFLFIFALVGVWILSEWLFYRIADYIPAVKFKRSK